MNILTNILGCDGKVTRKYTNKLLEMVDEGLLDQKNLIRDLLCWMSENEVQTFYEKYGYEEMESEDEDEEDEIDREEENEEENLLDDNEETEDLKLYLPTLSEFLKNLNTIPRNSYINHENFSSLYMRKGHYRANDKIEKITIQIANIESYEPGKGAFTELCNEIKTLHPTVPIIVENVLNVRFRKKLVNLGFIKINDDAFLGPEIPTYILY